jgi:predicted DNA-binding transcriptional regulator YafY
MSINKKTDALFKLMERFLTQKEISSYDEALLQEFKCDKKTLERYLKDIESLYSHIITIKQSRKKVWKLVSVSDIFAEFIKNSEDISQLFLMAQEFDPYIFKELEQGTLSKLAKSDENVFLFKNSIMEEIQSSEEKAIFKKLKSAIANFEYRDIVYRYNETIIHKNVKCIKLVFIDNNWYLILVDEAQKLLFRRLSFIIEVHYASKTAFHKKDIKPYLDFLKTVQNAMTLYGVEPKRATIKATPMVAKYFDKDMKIFLPSQNFKKKLADGSVLFTLNYTQELEILPLIQKWLPDLIIVEPPELKEAYVKKLQSTLEHYDAVLSD